jgi:glucokinase
MIQKLIHMADGLLSEKPDAVGISCGGPLNSEKGIIMGPPNLPGWDHVEIVEQLQAHYGVSVKLQNDANACALAEWKFGAGKGSKNMIFMTFGTGLGAGLILDGKLYSGTNGNAGELGHIRLKKKGPIGFGKEGSFEGFCSGGGIARLAVIMAKRRKKMPTCIEEMGGYENVTTKALSKAAFAGDPFARQVFAKSGEMLGRGLSVVIDVLNPQKIVLGGVFMRSGELLIPAMKKQIAREALQESACVCEIVPAQLSENIGDVAALAVAKGDE